MLFDTVQDVQRRCSMPSAVQCAASAVVWSVAAGEHNVLPIVDFGWMPRDVALKCIGEKGTVLDRSTDAVQQLVTARLAFLFIYVWTPT